MAMRTRFKWTEKPPANSSVKPRNDILAAHFFIDRPALINDPFGGKWTESLAGYSTSAALIGADGYRYEALNISGYYRGLKKPDVSIGSIEPGFIAVDIKSVGAVSKPIIHKGSWTATLGHWGTIQYNATSGYIEFNRGGYSNYRTWQINAPSTKGVFVVTWSTKSITETPVVYHNGVEVTVTSVGGSGTGDAVEWDTAAYIFGNIDAAGYSVGFAVLGKSRLSHGDLRSLSSSPYNFFFKPPRQAFYFDVGGGASPQTIGVTSTPETDTAQVISAVPGALLLGLGATTQTDAAQAIAAILGTVTVAVSAASETEAAQGLTPILGAATISITPATETDTAQTLTALVSGATSVSPATETDAAQTITPVPGAVTVALSATTETDAAQAIAALNGVSISLGAATELGSVGAITVVPGGVIFTLNAAAETGTAQALSAINGGVVTPDTRILQIAHELRTLTVVHENRTRSIQ